MCVGRGPTCVSWQVSAPAPTARGRRTVELNHRRRRVRLNRFRAVGKTYGNQRVAGNHVKRKSPVSVKIKIGHFYIGSLFVTNVPT